MNCRVGKVGELESWKVGKLASGLFATHDWSYWLGGFYICVDFIFYYLRYALLMESNIGVMRSMTCVSADMHH